MEGAVAFSWQLLQRTTPFSVQIRQMKVPQSAHGYPSDARSSLPHARQIIASRSCSGIGDIGPGQDSPTQNLQLLKSEMPHCAGVATTRPLELRPQTSALGSRPA